MTAPAPKTDSSAQGGLSACGGPALSTALDTRVRFAGHTDRGPRPRLEDAYGAWTLNNPLSAGESFAILTLCDGVGGQAGGDVASALAVRVAPASLLAELLLARVWAEDPAAPTVLENALQRALARTSAALRGVADQDARLQRMATTIVCAVIEGATLHVAWAGDSRCYRYGPNGLRRLTRDHREAEELVDAGVLAPEEVHQGAGAHIITRCLGYPGECAADYVSVPLSSGDVVLLCTDGLTDALAHNDLADLIEHHTGRAMDFADLPGVLVQAALDAGTRDNTTVLGCQYQSSRTTRRATVTESYPSALAKTCATLEDLA